LRKALEKAKTELDFKKTGGVFYIKSGRGRLGIYPQELTEQLRQYFGVEKGRGVLVSSVIENTPASKVGLKAGDCICEVKGAPIGSIGELGKELAKVDSGEVRIVVVREHQRIELRPQLEPRSENQFNWGYEGPGSWDTESFGNFDFEPSDFQVYVNPANLVVP